MLALPTLLIGLSAVLYVKGTSHSAPRHPTDMFLHRRQAPNFDGDTPDFGSCNSTCAPLVSKETACNFAGDFAPDSQSLACICTNDFVGAMATCVNCLAPNIAAEDLEQFQESVQAVIEACNESGHAVDTPTLTNGTSSAGASQTASSSNTSATASSTTTPSGSGGASPMNTAGPNTNGTQQPPNSALGASAPHVVAVVAGTFGISAIAAMWC